MSLRKVVSNLINATLDGYMTDAEAFNQLRKYMEEEDFILPKIPRNKEEIDELEQFIELAQKISAKYSI